MDKELLDLLTDARQEILRLRRSNEIFSAQMAVVEVFAAALGLKRAESGQTIDIAWSLQKRIDSIEENKA
jgi:hypothetical protein